MDSFQYEANLKTEVKIADRCNRTIKSHTLIVVLQAPNTENRKGMELLPPDFK
jgi:hypothetical protein